MANPSSEQQLPDSTWWTHDTNGNWWDASGSALTTAPMQPSKVRIPYVVAEEAWKEYRDQGHGDQSLQRLNERGGFSAEEIMLNLYERIRRLQGMSR